MNGFASACHNLYDKNKYELRYINKRAKWITDLKIETQCDSSHPVIQPQPSQLTTMEPYW